MLNPWVSVLRDASLQTLSYDNVEHVLRYSASVTDAELVLDGDGHRDQAEHGDDHEPPLEAEVAIPLVQVVHGEDEERCAEEELHVTHEVPRLAEAGDVPRQVGDVEEHLPPVGLADVPVVLRLEGEGPVRDEVLRQGDVEPDDEGQGNGEPAISEDNIPTGGGEMLCI